MLRRLSLAIGLLAAAAFCQHFPSTAGRQRDLDFVATELPKRHPNFFFHLDRAAFAKKVAELNAVVETATDAQFYTSLARLVSMAGDAHTTLNVSGAPFSSFPLRLRWFEDGVFVTRAAAAYSDALGAELVRIGDTPIGDALSVLAEVIPHENQAWMRAMAPNYLINQTILQGLGLTPETSTSALTFRDRRGREFTLDVGTEPATMLIAVPEDRGPVPLYQQNGTANYWYSYLPASRMLYFRYNACANAPGNPFTVFAVDLLNALDTNAVDTFVFDVRSNGGGGSGIIAPLFNGLAARFAKLAANPLFRIYDVFDNGTFSSGMLNAEDLLLPYPQSIPNPNRGVNLSARVISIGQASGGKPSAYGNVVGFALPGSGISGQNSTQFFAVPPQIPDRESLEPQIPVRLRSTDYFARFDPVMSMILGRGAGAPLAPDGDAITVNGASLRIEQGVAPGSYASVFGNFGAVPDEVTVGGFSAAPLAATASQVNFLVPDSVSPGRTAVEVRAGGKTLATGTTALSRSGPGLFVSDPASMAQPGAILNDDGSLNSEDHPAAPGSIVQIFGTGYGGETAQVYLSEQPAEVLFSGTVSQFPGLWQLNVRVRAGLSGQTPVFVFSGALPSNGVTLWVRAPVAP